MFSACQCSGMLFKRHKQARTLLPLSCKGPCGDLLCWEGEQSHLWATIEFSVSLPHHHCSLQKTTSDPGLGGFITLLGLWSGSRIAQDAHGVSIKQMNEALPSSLLLQPPPLLLLFLCGLHISFTSSFLSGWFTETMTFFTLFTPFIWHQMQTVTSMTKWDLLPLPSSAKAKSHEKHLFLGEAFYFSLSLCQENPWRTGLCGAELLNFVVMVIESKTDTEVWGSL